MREDTYQKKLQLWIFFTQWLIVSNLQTLHVYSTFQRRFNLEYTWSVCRERISFGHDINYRNSDQMCSVKKMLLKISQNSQENTCARISFLIKLQAWQRCFPVNFVKVLRTLSLIEHLWWLLLELVTIKPIFEIVSNLVSSPKETTKILLLSFSTSTLFVTLLCDRWLFDKKSNFYDLNGNSRDS